MITHGNPEQKLIHAIAYFAANATPRNTGLGITKLMKLLYFLDYFHYKETGFSVTGEEYSAWPFGPVPKRVWVEFKDKKAAGLDLNKYFALLPTKQDENLVTIATKKHVKFDATQFSKREMRILVQVSEMFRDATAKMISEVSHIPGQPWKKTIDAKGAKAHMDYDLILADMPQDQIEDIKEYQHTYSSFFSGAHK